MAHNLNLRSNGKANMMYVGKRPWHGLGTELNQPATAKEAIEAAQLDYTVLLEPVFLHNGNNIDQVRATVREDTQDILGIVSKRYRIVQNIGAFDFFDTLVGEGQAIYQTAGALGKGERIWILAKLPKNLTIVREDIVEKYLVLTNSHDGTSALRMYFTPIRVVCQNTLNASLLRVHDGISIRHTGNINSKIAEARKILGISIDYYAQFERIAKQLVDVKLNVSKAEEFFNKVSFKDTPKDKITNKMVETRDEFLNLFETGKGNNLPQVQHTAWAAINAVTEWVDHKKRLNNLSKDPTHRLNDIWFGNGAHMKEKAFNDITELCGIKIR